MQTPTPNPDVFETQCWAYRIIHQPQELLAECFDYATPGRFRKYIRWMLQAAAEPRICTKEEPGQLMAAFQVINPVMLAAEALLQQHQAEEPQPENAGLSLPKLRLLGRKDRADPYRVFGRFFKYQSTSLWKQDLNRALGYALVRRHKNMLLNHSARQMMIAGRISSPMRFAARGRSLTSTTARLNTAEQPSAYRQGVCMTRVPFPFRRSWIPGSYPQSSRSGY